MKKILSCAKPGLSGHPGFFSPLYRVKKRACLVTMSGNHTKMLQKYTVKNFN